MFWQSSIRKVCIPSPEADKTTLLRRVTFDLTGLPPSPAELNAFLADDSPQAYEKVLDRLLASPHYGERMAMQWLDFARYADTHGYHIDSGREMWPWRDWVIQAFNNNMPYDQFTIEQIAGDLLPHPTQSQVIATGFNRNHMINFEGGAIPEEYQNEYIVDRIEATSTTWLGITLGCARCHDHKYDPLHPKRFLQLRRILQRRSRERPGWIQGQRRAVPATAEQQQSGDERPALKAIKRRTAQSTAAQTAWEQHQREMPVSDVTSGLTAEYTFEDSLANRLSRMLPRKWHTESSLTRTGAPAVLPISKRSLTFRSVTPELFTTSSHSPLLVGQARRTFGYGCRSALWKSPKTGPGYELALDYCAKGIAILSSGFVTMVPNPESR